MQQVSSFTSDCDKMLTLEAPTISLKQTSSERKLHHSSMSICSYDASSIQVPVQPVTIETKLGTIIIIYSLEARLPKSEESDHP